MQARRITLIGGLNDIVCAIKRTGRFEMVRASAHYYPT